MHNKLLIVWCLISTALFCFTNASPTMYEFKGDLVQNKLSSISQKRDYGAQEKISINDVTKRDVVDTRALDIARAKAAEPNADTQSVIQALFELLIGENNSIASRAAQIISTAGYYDEMPALIEYIFKGSPINEDSEQFLVEFTKDRMNSSLAVGITLSLVPQTNRRLMLNHPDLGPLLEIIAVDPSALGIGEQILNRFGDSFSYRGPFTTSLVAEVIVAAVFVSIGESGYAEDIPSIMSNLYL